MRLRHATIGAAIVALTSPVRVASSSIFSPDISIIQNPSENVSTSLIIPVTPIDPRFHITGRRTPSTPLALNSLLMTAVNVMSKLALLDWNGKVASFRNQKIPDYSEVSIVMKAVPPAQRIDIRVAVWGLFAAIDDMRVRDRFVSGEYDLYWDGPKVATLRVKSAVTSRSGKGGQLEENESLDQMLPTLPSDSSSSENGTKANPPSTLNTGMLKDGVFFPDGHYVPQGQSLAFKEVLLPIICALRDIAAVPKTSFLDAKFLVQPVGIDSKVLFGGRNYGPISSRNTYQYKWAIRTLQEIPIFFLMNDRFAEMYMNIIVDGVYLGVGGLDKREGQADTTDSI